MLSAATVVAAQHRSSELPPSFPWLHLSVDFIWTFDALLSDGLLGWTYARPILSGCGAPCTGLSAQLALSSVQPQTELWTSCHSSKRRACLRRVLLSSRNGLVLAVNLKGSWDRSRA